MNKLLLLLSLIVLSGVNQLSAQCTPIPFYTGELTNPDTTQGIAPAAETQAYNQIIHMRIPADTNYNGAVIPIDSVGITDIVGMPANFTWLTNSNNNYWPGDTFGCIIFQGNPIVGQAGNFSIEVKITVHALGSAMPYTMYYRFKILDDTHVGYNLIEEEKFNLLQNSPNPFSSKTSIKYFSPNNNSVNFVVYDILGNIVFENSYPSSPGNNTIEFERAALANGIYVYELRNADRAIRKRMVIK